MGDSKMCKDSCSASLMWWSTLLVAVLAVPSFAIIITKTFNVQGIVEVLVFIITCWVSTYLGMRLMKNPRGQEAIKPKSSDNE